MNITPHQAKAELCKRSLFRFVQEFWHVVSPEDPVWNWHIEYLCNTLQEDLLRVCKVIHTDPLTKKETVLKDREPKLHDGIANVPPGSSKSTIYTIMAPAWLWTVDPTIKVLTASYSADLAIDHAVKSRDVIQSDKYRLYFPHIEIRADHNNKANYKNTKLGERYATSVGGSITGFHAHVIIIDDPINTKQAASEAELETAISFMDSTLPTRKINKEVTFTQIVMQRLHELDPTGHWLKKKGKQIRHVCLPAILSELVSPPELSAFYIDGLMDAKRMPRKVLEEMLIELGSYNFAGQMGQAPAPEGGGVWQKWIIPVPDRDFPNPSELEKYGTDWDTAYTDKKTNASSAYVTSGKKGNKMFIDKFGYFQKEFPELIKAMRLQAAPHYIEAKASGKSAKQTLTTAGIPAIEVQVNADKLARARDATPKAEAGMVYCRASLLDKLYNDDQQGILKFPNGPKADVADTLSQAIQRHFGTVTRTGSFGWDEGHDFMPKRFPNRSMILEPAAPERDLQKEKEEKERMANMINPVLVEEGEDLI